MTNNSCVKCHQHSHFADLKRNGCGLNTYPPSPVILSLNAATTAAAAAADDDDDEDDDDLEE